MAGRRRACDVLVALNPRSIQPVDGLKHSFGRSGLTLRDAELLERGRPFGPRDRKGLDVGCKTSPNWAAT